MRTCVQTFDWYWYCKTRIWLFLNVSKVIEYYAAGSFAVKYKTGF